MQPFAELLLFEPFLDFFRVGRGRDVDLRSFEDLQVLLSLVEDVQDTLELLLHRLDRLHRVLVRNVP